MRPPSTGTSRIDMHALIATHGYRMVKPGPAQTLPSTFLKISKADHDYA